MVRSGADNHEASPVSLRFEDEHDVCHGGQLQLFLSVWVVQSELYHANSLMNAHMVRITIVPRSAIALVSSLSSISILFL